MSVAGRAEVSTVGIIVNPHAVTILYFNCKHLDVVAADQRFTVESVELVRHQAGAGQHLATISMAEATADERSNV